MPWVGRKEGPVQGRRPILRMLRPAVCIGALAGCLLGITSVSKIC